jgi:hypothetical protein
MRSPLSPLLALFIRALRDDSRAHTTYSMRVVMVLCLLGVMVFTTYFEIPGTAPGLAFFSRVIWLQFVVITFLGASWFVSAVTEEKEEETLGLLCMTNLNPLSILLGVSTSRLCGALLTLCSGLPFAFIAQTLGGVSHGQVLAAYCTLAAYVFLLGNLALACSVLADDMLWAVCETIIGMALFCATGFGLSLGLQFSGVAPGSWPVVGFLAHMSPVVRILEILETGFTGPLLGWQVGTNLILGGVCFLVAWNGFARYADIVAEGRAEDENDLPASRHRYYEENAPRRAPRVWSDALAWKDFYFFSGGSLLLGLRVLGYAGVWLMAGTFLLPGASGSGDVWASSQFLRWVVLIETSFAASRIIREELRQRTWSTLILLPYSLSALLWGKARGALVALLPAFVTLLGALLVLVFATNSGRSLTTVEVCLAAFAAFVQIVGVTFLVAYLSVRFRRGGLALGLLIAFGLQQSLQTLAALTGQAAFIQTFSVLLYLGATFYFYRAILRRASMLAGET